MYYSPSYSSGVGAYLIFACLLPIIIYFAVAIGCGFVCNLNEKKGYQGGFAWGFLTWIGIIIVAVKEDRTKMPMNNYYGQPNPGYGSAPPQMWRCIRCGSNQYMTTSICSCGCTQNESLMYNNYGTAGSYPGNGYNNYNNNNNNMPRY